MDYVNKLVGEGSKDEPKKQEEKKSGGFMDKLNTMAGGGKESEKNEDALDKGLLLPYHYVYVCDLETFRVNTSVDWVQEHVLGQGDQSNESAVEQAKDEQISDFIRDQYKKTTGSDMPIKDKPRF
ncbi:hypothetical protein F4861DRAFT_540696 [Xylaria intraflava]|nr:hypothetical protein F4861DRAFT_540696 [Xylaria intraflava]